MIGLIALALSVLCCAIYVKWQKGDYKVRFFRDNVFFWFAPAINVIGIIVAWFAFGFNVDWAMGLWTSIVWTIILVVCAAGALLFGCLDDEEDEYDEYDILVYDSPVDPNAH